jgi:secreted Zn-dependent insulinase-like peptidase
MHALQSRCGACSQSLRTRCAPAIRTAPLAAGNPHRCDELSYRILSLDNGLRAVLVSDPETDKAAASLDVRVGSMLDPPGGLTC